MIKFKSKKGIKMMKMIKVKSKWILNSSQNSLKIKDYKEKIELFQVMKIQQKGIFNYLIIYRKLREENDAK